MKQFAKSFGRLVGLPKTAKLTKEYLRKCQKDQDKFKPLNKTKRKITKKTGWWFKFNKRTLRKKQKRNACY
jgi:hypothetical protein